MNRMPKYEKQSLSDRVVAHVKEQILAGTLKSGDRLIETDISTHFRISRAPVREAMRILNEQGLITFSPRKGNHVIEMNPAELMEAFEVRASLETQILRKLLREQRIKETDFQQLAKIAREMNSGEKRGVNEAEKFFLLNSLDISFHKYLWELSGNVRRVQILEGLFYQLLIVMNEDLSSLGVLEKKAEEHLRLVEVLRGNDPSAVVRAFHNHIQDYVKVTLPREEQNFCLDC
ncbi:GntR family transcriptional regulator [Enterococcus hulanensis]|uniref:GntR family transcriptional regulator n=1 Tax=Enterococcus hulanensis TaxID=2559929 RepID=A0ABU3EW54_9ENTE|nr:GntR family transcriptional regulator [Enterococcus hulanensis]MDT2598907.1 GntR family transcriptional regulator [Enterococcus hulanensis]MDT2610558.1 GntR family transcriptional regulator [Enterococcus hulanensis]MDT2614884.1 GntR family transcriptional regulator [Enterococcus hulanensis]MDT2627146.1 GntR family transcriptional regulator [Enterococcus hulanensis]MDT2653954.1 GntR family transcriptional regulator [Enterococcus hulanensis]